MTNGIDEGRVMNTGYGERVYVDHLLAEHRRLDRLVSQTLTALPNRESPGSAEWLPTMMAGLAAIRQELAQHFREEDEGGCLEEAVAHCPALSLDAGRVAAEHSHLLGDLDELIVRCGKLTQPTARDAHILGQELRAVIHKLHSHEAHENEIIQRGFGVCVENEDAS
jgi:hypothetical protein